ncbi:ornithine cyclodeaminase [Burkholderia sp. MSh2]|uniref:Ornithine cyclodeaminase n=1 Tax=Burkholderia paludis TaxID=1506587 RepID=A0A6J5D374_9BURK|nr:MULTISPECIES: ornithine cyclodeaminase family protein [Burkholderia]KEZ06976.1 ornithine cyclodeaminase [Burkholderia sp. MSh2]CAB3748658.1 Alanine dehydrogenase [Burkholderia paludis]VWB96611.1 ornithine cyclodeaminase [Burkholderia paludis]
MPTDARLLLLDRDAVEPALQAPQVMAAVREAFVLHSQRAGRVFPVVREKLHTGGVFGIKSGDIASQGVLGFKAAGFWPGNRRVGGEPHQATVALFDPDTGRPLCIMDGNGITTARTGAAGGLGLQHLARRDSTRICVFGTGVQARVQLDYALGLLPQRCTVQYVNVGGQPDPAFEAAFLDRCAIGVARDRNDAVAASDVVITATPGGGPLFDAEAVRPGTHLTCVGADTAGKRELPAGVLERARVVVDDRDQARSIGECQWSPDLPCTEIGDILSGAAAFDRAPHDITVFDMTGLALQDLTVARLLYRQALENGTGIAIPWPW